MEKINDGGSAFPHEHYREPPQSGMTLRDKFADSVLPAVYAYYIERLKRQEVHYSQLVESVARNSYIMADAMLKAREVQS